MNCANLLIKISERVFSCADIFLSTYDLHVNTSGRSTYRMYVTKIYSRLQTSIVSISPFTTLFYQFYVSEVRSILHFAGTRTRREAGVLYSGESNERVHCRRTRGLSYHLYIHFARVVETARDDRS